MKEREAFHILLLLFCFLVVTSLFGYMAYNSDLNRTKLAEAYMNQMLKRNISEDVARKIAYGYYGLAKQDAEYWSDLQELDKHSK